MRLYNDIADFYDSWTESDPASEPSRKFYLNQCTEVNATVLEIGCGTGRLLLELAKTGVSVLGVDTSLKMLEIAQSKCTNLTPQVKDNVAFIHSDIFEYTPSKNFQKVILPMRSLGHFLLPETRQQLFRKVFSLLEHNGEFLLDHFIFDPGIARRDEGIERKIFDKVSETGGIQLFHSHQCDFTNQILHSKLKVHEIHMGEIVREAVYFYDLAWVEPNEILQHCTQVGFAVKNLYGDFSLSKFDDDASEQVWILTKN